MSPVSAPTILLTAIEASADAMGAGLMRALKARLGPEIRFVGVGGEAMAAEGLVSAFDTRELSVLGLLEGLLVWRRARRRAGEIVALARRERPDVAVLIDAWGFSSMTGRLLKEAQPNLPLVKYVAPQLWATRPGRARRMAASFDVLLSILPFDAPYFEGLPIETHFVGHPVLAQDFTGLDGQRLRAALGIGRDAQVLLVLPGSRPAEIERVLPVFEQAVARLKAERPGLQVVVSLARPVADAVRARVAAWPFRAHVVSDEDQKRDAMAGCPMVIGYRLSGLTYAIAKRIVRVRFATLFNIAADRAVAPEFIQHDLTAANLVAAVAERLDEPALRARQVAEQYAALEKLGRGGPDPAQKAAEVIAALLLTQGEKG